MFVTIEDELGVELIERVPERLQVAVIADRARVESRMVPVGDSARLRTGREVGTQPLHLWGGSCRRDVAVKNDDVPRTKVIAVVALTGIAGFGAEVLVVTRRTRRVVFMITRRWHRTREEPAPRRLITSLIFGDRTILVRVVAGHEHGTGDRVDDLRSVVGVGERASRDVASADEYLRRGRRCNGHRARIGSIAAVFVRNGQADGEGAGRGIIVRARRRAGAIGLGHRC